MANQIKENEAANISPYYEQAAPASLVSVQGFLSFVRHRWYWYVISVAVCVGIAWLMLARSPRLYTKSETILIKDPTFGNSASSVDLSEVGVMPKYANLENEIAIFTSPDLMENVVKAYNLNNFYSYNDGFKDVDIYHQEPGIISSPDAANADASYSFKYIVKSDGTVILKDFNKGGTELPDKPLSCKLGATVKTPVGAIAIDRPEWVSDYVDKTIHYSHVPVRPVAESIVGGLKATYEAKEGTLIALSYTSTSPYRCEDVLNGVVQAYNDQWINDKKAIADATSDFISERLSVIEQELGNVDSDISSYKARTMSPDLEAQAQINMARSSELQNQQYDLSNQIQILNYVRGELSREGIDETLPSNMGIANTGLESQIQVYNQQVIERNRLLKTTGANNPQVVEKDEALRTMKRNIQHTAATYATSLNTRLSGVRSQESVTNSRLATAPRQANYLLSVERQQKVKESLYLFLLQKREENELAQAFKSYNTQVVRQPAGPGAPISPVSTNTYLIAVLIGLIIPSGVYVVKANLDNNVRSREDVENIGIPFIGEIPQKGRKKLGKDSSSERQVVVRADSTNVINEAFRVVRTNLDFFLTSDKKGAQVIMVTSANPGSGKTFITMNLAVALALKHKRVLMIDFDLRRAALSNAFGSPREGIANYLCGADQMSDIVQHNVNDVEGLDLIGVGNLPPNPSELLYSERLKTLLSTMEQEYDFIFFDCPPIEVVADSRILNEYVDTTIFVIRAGLFDRRMLKSIRNLYAERRYNNMCLLLNGTSVGHNYGYGYGYAYGDDNDKKKKKRKKS